MSVSIIKAKALTQLRAVALAIFGNDELETDADRIAYITEYHRDLLIATGHYDTENDVCTYTARLLWVHRQEGWDNIVSGRRVAAAHVFRKGLEYSMNVADIMHKRVEGTGGADTDASRELRGHIDLAARMTGAHAPERIVRIGEPEADEYDATSVMLANQRAEQLEAEARAVVIEMPTDEEEE